MKADPTYPKSAPIACKFTGSGRRLSYGNNGTCAARIARPVAMEPERAMGPVNHLRARREELQRRDAAGRAQTAHCRISWTRANGLLVPAWPPAPVTAGSTMSTAIQLWRRVRTCSYSHQAVGAFGYGLARESVVDDVVQNDAAAGVRRCVYVLSRAEGGDVQRHAVPCSARAA